MFIRTKLVFYLLAVSAALSANSQNFFVEQDMCVRCHLLSENLGQPTPVIPWKRSVHFREDSGCADCHGGNKYLYMDFQRGHIGLPSRAQITESCGKCHKQEMSDTLSRPAAEPGGSRCTANCIDCHGYHYVPEASIDLVNEVTCGSCHSFNKVEPSRDALADTEAAFASIEGIIASYEREGIPVLTFKRDLDGIRNDLSRSFHREPPEKIREAAINIRGPLENLEDRIRGSSPLKWRAKGLIVVAFLSVLLTLIIGYQKIVGSKEDEMDKKKDRNVEAGELKPHEPKTVPFPLTEKGGGSPAPSRPGSSWTTIIALLLALTALLLVIQEKMSGTDKAIQSISHTITKTVVPQLNKATDRDLVNSAYELKRMMVTLDEIKEVSTSDEIKTRIDKIKADLEELSVKILVHE